VRTDSHQSVARERVNEGELARHQIAKLEGGRAWVLAGGLGRPRLWARATDSALDGWTKSLDATRGHPPETRLEHAIGAARQSLASTIECLVEREVPDVTLAGLLLEAGALHVITAGTSRIYVQRGAQPHRLTPREEPTTGLLATPPTRSTFALEPGDLVLAGSVSAFSMRSISRLSAVLEEDPHAAPAVLVSVLTEPAALAGLGAAAVALRVS
jgi:hypothetical protein